MIVDLESAGSAPLVDRIVAALKQHRRQARAVQQALASLRQLPPFAQ